MNKRTLRTLRDAALLIILGAAAVITGVWTLSP